MQEFARNELVTSCRHANKFLLKKVKNHQCRVTASNLQQPHFFAFFVFLYFSYNQPTVVIIKHLAILSEECYTCSVVRN